MDAPRPQALEAGLFLLVAVLPLALFPLSEAAFVDVKLPVLVAATLLIWVSGVGVERRLVAPAALLGMVLVLAAAFGVDPAVSMVGSLRPTGLVMLACTLALVVVAPRIPTALLDRARGWLVWAALVAAAVALLEQVTPETLDRLVDRESFLGATLGNPVILAGFLAAAIPAALPTDRPAWRTVATFAILGSAFGVIGERSALVLPFVAFGASWWWTRPALRVLAVPVVTLVMSTAAWLVAPDAVVNVGGDRVAEQFSTLTGERQRVAMWGAFVRGVAERPLLGWGPANEWTAFVASGTEEQLETAGRAWGDAHNLFLDVAAVAGIPGLVALGWLLARLRRAVRPRPERAWAAAAAAVLVTYSMYEPLDPTLTPLLFVFAGAAASPTDTEAVRARAHVAIAAVALGSMLALTLVGMTSSSLEQWARTHAGSRWAFERAWAIAPWRVSAGEGLAIELALDGRAGDAAAAEDARDVVDRLVERHPWNPGVRLLAADVELLLRDFPETQEWIRRHLERFPNDTVEVPEQEPGTTAPLGNALEGA